MARQENAFDRFLNASHGFLSRKPHCVTFAWAVRQLIALPPDTHAASSTSKPASGAKSAAPFPRIATIIYGIGAQKAGTSWLLVQLAKSVDCHVTPTKELHHFDAMNTKGEENHMKTRLAQLNQLVKEVTPGIDTKTSNASKTSAISPPQMPCWIRRFAPR